MLKRIYAIIEKPQDSDKASKIYDIFMIIIILVSIFPLCFIKQIPIFTLTDKITVILFIIDYLLRWLIADVDQNKGIQSFLLYPFRPMAIIDLLSILPSISHFHSALKIFKLLRLFRTFRIFKLFRYSKNIEIILNVLQKQRQQLFTVCALTLGYIFISALIVFQIEPATFGRFFSALYWSTVSLTTIGYGDITPVTDIGRFISMISSLLGIAVVALPSGIIISGFSKELKNEKD